MGILKNIFTRKIRIRNPDMTFHKAVDIAGEYGKALENLKSSITDISYLPYPKPVIKQALKTLLKEYKDPELRAQIANAYIMLSNWQSGVGEGSIAPRHAKSNTENFERNQMCSAVAYEETQTLRNELKAIGYR